MRFWRSLLSGASLNSNSNRQTPDRDRRSESLTRGSASTPSRRRSSSFKGSLTSLTEDSSGTTFVELIKRSGTHLGVIVTGGKDTGLKPRIADLVPGSWAQRSNVLCVGDILLSLNGKSCHNMRQHQIVELLDTADKVQLEVKYRLPSVSNSKKTRPKLIQMSVQKENGSYGMVIRGGAHDTPAKSRPFTVVHVDKDGPTQREGIVRSGDRILSLNGRSLEGMKLPELQSCMYQEDGETTFTVEYDVGKQMYPDQSAALIEIYREPGDVLGIMLESNPDTKAILVHTIQEASLADRCGAIHVGDMILAISGVPVSRKDIEEVNNLIRESGSTVRLEILPGAAARARCSVRSSLPSPCLSTMRRFTGPCRIHNPPVPLSPACRIPESPAPLPHRKHLNSQMLGNEEDKERRKTVAFTVELDRSNGPLGITLATSQGDNNHHKENRPSIYISAMTEGGLANMSKAIQIGDELIEVNGKNIKGLKISEAIPLLKSAGKVVKLKLSRNQKYQQKPPSPFATLNRKFQSSPTEGLLPGGGVNMRTTTPPSSPIYAPIQHTPPYNHNHMLPHHTHHHLSPSMGHHSFAFSTPPRDLGYGVGGSGFVVGQGRQQIPQSPSCKPNRVTFKDEPDIGMSTLLPRSGSRSGDSDGSGLPLEVTRVCLYKDKVYEDFGFSVSDGLYEKGIYVNRIRKGGPAHASGMIKPYDRILQINQSKTTDIDCCLAVPLIASAGDKIELLITRPFPDCEGGVLVDEHNPYDSQRSSVSSNYPQNTITASSPYSQNTIDRHSNSLNRNQSPNATLNRNHPSQGFRLTNQSPILMRRSTNQSPTSLSQRLSNHSSRNSGGSDDHLTIGGNGSLGSTGSTSRSAGYAVRPLPVQIAPKNENAYGYIPSRMDSGYGSVPTSGINMPGGTTSKSALGHSNSSAVPWIDETDKESNMS